MQRVHRNLSRGEIEGLRDKLADLIPQAHMSIPEVIKTLRLITRKSQAEYAALCGVAPKVLATIERGQSAPTTKTLEKLLRPFGLGIGVVSLPQERGQ
ncbi:MAG: helix-turn-helix domain-containing protein [Gallionella sp.]|jgi:DNA-binding XRE family transcriptional regulator|nr:helix-turn-helix domain-containing protein [Gallionella sp.]